MALVPIAEASHRLGVSIHTLKRRLKRGDLLGEHKPTPQGFIWMVDVPDGTPEPVAAISSSNGATAAATPPDVPDGTLAAVPADIHRLETLVATLQDQVQLMGQQLNTKDHQIGELLIVVRQAQAMLPAPKVARHWWRLWRR